MCLAMGVCRVSRGNSLPEASPIAQMLTGEPVNEAKHQQILVVDDEESVRKLISTVLVNKGHTVDDTAEAAEALLKM
jgi:PleD family two-component response regulator